MCHLRILEDSQSQLYFYRNSIDLDICCREIWFFFFAKIVALDVKLAQKARKSSRERQTLREAKEKKIDTFYYRWE